MLPSPERTRDSASHRLWCLVTTTEPFTELANFHLAQRSVGYNENVERMIRIMLQLKSVLNWILTIILNIFILHNRRQKKKSKEFQEQSTHVCHRSVLGRKLHALSGCTRSDNRQWPSFAGLFQLMISTFSGKIETRLLVVSKVSSVYFFMTLQFEFF